VKVTDFRVPLEPNTIAPHALRAILGFMTEGELATALNITETTLAQWRKSGSGPIPVKIGRGVFYTHAMVSAWLEVTEEEQCDELEKELEQVIKVAEGKDVGQESGADGYKLEDTPEPQSHGLQSQG
jgi:hypothetical protein